MIALGVVITQKHSCKDVSYQLLCVAFFSVYVWLLALDSVPILSSLPRGFRVNIGKSMIKAKHVNMQPLQVVTLFLKGWFPRVVQKNLIVGLRLCWLVLLQQSRVSCKHSNKDKSFVNITFASIIFISSYGSANTLLTNGNRFKTDTH